MTENHLSTRQLADRFGVQPQTIRVWRLKGYGPPYIRLGAGKSARVAYRIEDVKSWEEARAFTSTSAETFGKDVA